MHGCKYENRWLFFFSRHTMNWKEDLDEWARCKLLHIYGWSFSKVISHGDLKHIPSTPQIKWKSQSKICSHLVSTWVWVTAHFIHPLSNISNIISLCLVLSARPPAKDPWGCSRLEPLFWEFLCFSSVKWSLNNTTCLWEQTRWILQDLAKGPV